MKSLPLFFGVLLSMSTLARDTSGQGSPFVPNDPYFFSGNPSGFPGQWHLDKQSSGAVIDANVSAAWSKGWTGSGVQIGIAENYFDGSHPDLQPNYRPEYDMNTQFVNVDDHATAVAGVAAGRGGNGIGTTGAAPYANISRLGVDVANYLAMFASEATALNHRNDIIDIKSFSIGMAAADVFYTLDTRTTNTWDQARAQAVAAGTIVVRSASNGYTNANYYVDKNIPDRIVVGATGSNGKKADYSNYGSNLTVSAPSLGSSGTFGITTTDRAGNAGYNSAGASESRPDSFPDLAYTTQFSGTSSAAPLVSGVLALAKEAQLRLDMRFVKHLLARTSAIIDADDNTFFRTTIEEGLLTDISLMKAFGKWRTNSAGIHFNNGYGFGLIDATALVDAAQEYVGVTPLQTYATGNIGVSKPVPENASISRQFTLGSIGALEELEFDFSIVAAPGDFNADGFVDGMDYLKWQRTFGASLNLAADDNGNGVVDAADYVIWRKHFGEGGGTSFAAVPEPASAFLLVVASACCFGRHRRQCLARI